MAEPNALQDDTPGLVNGQPCPHEDAVKWNPWNKVVQCHRCGVRFMPVSTPAPDEPTPMQLHNGMMDYVTGQMGSLSRRIDRLEALPGVAEVLYKTEAGDNS